MRLLLKVFAFTALAMAVFLATTALRKTWAQQKPEAASKKDEAATTKGGDTQSIKPRDTSATFTDNVGDSGYTFETLKGQSAHKPEKPEKPSTNPKITPPSCSCGGAVVTPTISYDDTTGITTFSVAFTNLICNGAGTSGPCNFVLSVNITQAVGGSQSTTGNIWTTNSATITVPVACGTTGSYTWSGTTQNMAGQNGGYTLTGNVACSVGNGTPVTQANNSTGLTISMSKLDPCTGK